MTIGTDLDEALAALGAHALRLADRITAAEARIAALEAGSPPSDPGPSDPGPVDPDPEEPEPSGHPLAGVKPVQLGTWHPNVWSGELAFADAAKHVAREDVTFRSAAFDVPDFETIWPRFGWDEALARGLVSQGGALLGLPAEGQYFVGWSAAPAEPTPLAEPETWVLSWDGDATARVEPAGLPAGARVETTGPRRREITIPAGAPAGFRIEIFGLSAPVSNVRAWRKADDARVAAGGRFRPSFVEAVRRYGVVRTMDWTKVNGSYLTRVDRLPGPDAPFWGDGVPLEAQAQLGVEAGVVLWTNAPAYLGASDGLIKALKAEPDQRRRVSLIAGEAAAIVASDEWDRWARRLVAALDAAGYPADRPVIAELSNEVWNWGAAFSAQSELGWGITEWLAIAGFDGQPMRPGYGYLSMRLAAAMDAAVKASANPDRKWSLALGTHTAWAPQTKWALQGADLYFRDNEGEHLKPRIGLATTTYWTGALTIEPGAGNLYGATDQQDYWRRLKADIAADPAGLMERLADWLIRSQEAPYNVRGQIRLNGGHAALIEAWGGFFLGNYEGGSHDAYYGGDPEIAAFATAFNRSAARARVTRAMAAAWFAAFPNAILANYVGQGAMHPQSPWSDAGPGEDTPEEAAWADVAAAAEVIA